MTVRELVVAFEGPSGRHRVRRGRGRQLRRRVALPAGRRVGAGEHRHPCTALDSVTLADLLIRPITHFGRA